MNLRIRTERWNGLPVSLLASRCPRPCALCDRPRPGPGASTPAATARRSCARPTKPSAKTPTWLWMRWPAAPVSAGRRSTGTSPTAPRWRSPSRLTTWRRFKIQVRGQEYLRELLRTVLAMQARRRPLVRLFRELPERQPAAVHPAPWFRCCARASKRLSARAACARTWNPRTWHCCSRCTRRRWCRDCPRGSPPEPAERLVRVFLDGLACSERVNALPRTEIRRSEPRKVIDRRNAGYFRITAPEPGSQVLLAPGRTLRPRPGPPSARHRHAHFPSTGAHHDQRLQEAWHAKLQREQEAIQRKRAQQATRTPAGTSATPR